MGAALPRALRASRSCSAWVQRRVNRSTLVSHRRDPNSITVVLQTRLELPTSAATAWRLLTDTEAWLQWGPSVRAVDAPARLIGPGSCGRVQTVMGVWLPFEITRWRPGREWAWRVAGIPATGHIVAPLAPSRCRVTFTIPPWAPFYLPVCRVALRRLHGLAMKSDEGQQQR